MAYVLEKITPEVVEKILGDLISQPQAREGLVNKNVLTQSHDLKWAVDHAANNYMFPNSTYDREFGRSVEMFFNGFLYTVHVIPSENPRKRTTVRKGYVEVTPVPPDLKRELTAAFEVHGVFGNGPINIVTGKPAAYAQVLPVFSDEVL